MADEKRGGGVRATIYTSPICPQCRRAKQFLQEQGVELQEIDISGDPALAANLKEKTGVKLVPVVEIRGTYYPGFIRRNLEKAIQEARS